VSGNMTINQVVTQTIHILSQINGEIMLAFVVLCVLLLLILLYSLRQIRKLTKQLSLVQHDLKVTNSSLINIGKQLLSLEKKVNQQVLSEPVSRNENALNKINKTDFRKPQSIREDDFNLSNIATDNDNSSLDKAESIYDKARYYLAKDEDVESIAKRCNLSYAEVSLLKALGKKPAESL
jgi:septal ring factor EnvC (AmiA/AmiB activator)